MRKEQSDLLERLNFLLPYANRFVAKLHELYSISQDEQLAEIFYPLNELVEWSCRYSGWPRWFTIDTRSHSLVDSFEELKDCRNLIAHASKTLTYEETLTILNNLYAHGEQISWKISRIIGLIESEEMP